MFQQNSIFKILIMLLTLMWLIHLINFFTGHYLNQFGVYPRQWSHLIGIIFSPFLHGNIPHLVANSIPFLILGLLVHQTKQLVFVSAFVIMIGGLAVWLFARSAYHIGASGLIMGYFGFLLSHAFFTRTLRNIIIALLTFIVYGGLLFSLLDFRTHISFEAHIFGFISGVIAAKLISKRSAQ